jgi:thiamine phosphate synthase YjbQ (UPF0047 family)
MVWFQQTIKVKAPQRGYHLITNEVEKQISSDLSKIKVGLAHFFIQHTSAGLTSLKDYSE